MVQCCGGCRQKDQYEVKWFIPLVELSLEDRLQSRGLSVTVIVPFVCLPRATCGYDIEALMCECAALEPL